MIKWWVPWWVNEEASQSVKTSRLIALDKKWHWWSGWLPVIFWLIASSWLPTTNCGFMMCGWLPKWKGWGLITRCLLFDRGGRDGRFNSSRVLLRWNGDNRLSIRKANRVVAELTQQSIAMHLPFGQWKFCVSNGNAIKLQWLVDHCGTSQKKQWFQEARR